MLTNEEPSAAVHTVLKYSRGKVERHLVAGRPTAQGRGHIIHQIQLHGTAYRFITWKPANYKNLSAELQFTAHTKYSRAVF
jgi:hypothetical protein